MRIRQFAAALFLGVLIAGLISTLAPQVVYAQCGLVGQPPCEKKTKIPTRVPPSRTPTPTSTPTPTLLLAPQYGGEGGTLIPIGPAPADTATPTTPPWYLTVVACRNSLEATAISTLGHDDIPPAEPPGVHETIVAPCERYVPTATPFFIPPTAGPVFLLPGVKNVLILVLIIGVLFTGGVLIARAGKKITK